MAEYLNARSPIKCWKQYFLLLWKELKIWGKVITKHCHGVLTINQKHSRFVNPPLNHLARLQSQFKMQYQYTTLRQTVSLTITGFNLISEVDGSANSVVSKPTPAGPIWCQLSIKAPYGDHIWWTRVAPEPLTTGIASNWPSPSDSNLRSCFVQNLFWWTGGAW